MFELFLYINLKLKIMVKKKIDGRLVIYLSLLSVVLFAKSLLALSEPDPIKTTVMIEQWTQIEQTVVPLAQLNASEVGLVEVVIDAGNDSNLLLLYLTSSLNIIQTEPKSFLKRQVIIEKELTRKSLLKGKRLEKSMFLYVIGATWKIHEKSTGVYRKPTAFS